MTRGEIWLGEFGIPYGSEIGYSRPVLIVQDDGFNESRIKTIVVLSLTKSLRLLDAPGNVLIKKNESKLKEDSVIIVTQLYAIDKSRLKGKYSKITMEKVEIGMKLVLGIN